MENYEEFEQLLNRHSFKELNDDEKIWVKNFVNSEEEYESLRLADQRLNSYFNTQKRVSPSPQLWKRIINTRKNSSMNWQLDWIKMPIPAYATLMLLIGVGVLSWYSGANYSSINKAYGVKSKLHVDTVFIASKPDTVVRERIIYLKPEGQAAPSLQVSNKNLPDHQIMKGINMKEKEELEKLLVSGSM